MGTVPAHVMTYLSGHLGVLVALVLALGATGWRPVWRWTRTVVTIAHEGGHALVAVLAGRGLTGIRLHPDTSGVTVSTGARRGPGLVLTFLAGYPAPSLVGLAGALFVANGHARVMLWIGVGLLAVTLVLVRNGYGVLAVLATGVLVGYVAAWAPARIQVGFAAALCWFLVLGGLRATRELRPRRGGASDADMLARLTHVPGAVWRAFFWLVAGGAVVAAGWVLLV
jgi:Peptidase M50B-like